MAQNITLLGASYPDVPAVELPKTGGGTAKFADPSVTTAQPSDVAAGKIFLNAQGEPTTGTGSGGGTEAPEKQINFVDYDGTIRYSYTAAEFAELAELPPNPNHTGKIAQGWNWTLAQINAQLADCPGGAVWVGQQYTTSDGKTHIRISIPSGAPSSRRTFGIRFQQTDGNGVSVDWGDGSTPESHSSTSQSLDHTYAESGEYDITLDVVSGTMSFISAIAKTDDRENNRAIIIDIAFGDGVTSVGEQALYGIYSRFTVSVPSGVLFGDYYMCGSAYGLPASVIPSGTTSVAERMYRYCYGLSVVSVPSGVTSIGPNAFYDNTGLRGVTIPGGVTSIGANAFGSCRCLMRIDIPSSVTSIGDSAFSGCTVMGAYHIRATTPPTLGSSAFSSIPSDCVIYVPRGSGSAYRSASGWSACASQIQEEAS